MKTMNCAKRSFSRAFGRTFAMTPLPYDQKALEPVLSAETLDFHYNKHHTGYFNKLTAFANEKRPELKDKSLEELVREETGFVFNQAAQIYNHDFYWNSMTPNGEKTPTGALAEKINEDFGGFEAFKKVFLAEVGSHFGSGWVWLVQDKTTKKLSVMSTHDAACPITDSNVQPLLTCDAWEHAFYIDYRNDKPTYAENFFKVANWEFAASNLLH